MYQSAHQVSLDFSIIPVNEKIKTEISDNWNETIFFVENESEFFSVEMSKERQLQSQNLYKSIFLTTKAELLQSVQFANLENC